MARSLALALALLTLVISTAPIAQTNRLKGAWKVIAVTGADGRIDEAPPAGLYIFTERHYSMQRVTAVRAVLPEKPTDIDLLTAFGPYTANSGTYEVNGATLKTTAVVAKSPNAMVGQSATSEVTFDGTQTVHIRSATQNGAKTAITLQRLE